MKIAILTPTYDSKVSARYSFSLAETIKLYPKLDVIFLEGDAIIQSARNKLISIAHNYGYEQVVWIDSDIDWNPLDFQKLLHSDKEVIGATYRRKDLKESYSFKSTYPVPQGDIIKVDGIGFGFLKMSKNAIESLWNSENEYLDDSIICRSIFEINIEDGKVYSEDYVVCKKLKELNFEIYLDKSINLNHQSTINLMGNFNDWSKNI